MKNSTDNTESQKTPEASPRSAPTGTAEAMSQVIALQMKDKPPSKERLWIYYNERIVND